MEKFVIYSNKPGGRTSLTNITIHTKAYEKIRAVSKENNVTMVSLLDMMVDFCLERLEVR